MSDDIQASKHKFALHKHQKFSSRMAAQLYKKAMDQGHSSITLTIEIFTNNTGYIASYLLYLQLVK